VPRTFEFPTPEEPEDLHLSPTQIAKMIQDRQNFPERSFDSYLPKELQPVSGQFWTPIEVAQRVADWLQAFGIRTVVDIGSGPGKFCVVAALASQCNFIGIEQRPRLVSAARELVMCFSLEGRVSFVEGAFGDIETPLADAYYMYNPFGENLFEAADHLDNEVELGTSRFSRDTAAASRLLRDAAPGTFLITYNGFGGLIPYTYKKLRTDLELSSVLRLWVKEKPILTAA
jgi:predicted RNA methylase